ncbi:hypothetical protein BJ165DRAFT_1595754 [Panaeolus papilionaceus]|nr:hypothetical protein BJ165DRAFT_1595754 [Panaeolus papilionaceus]
MRLSSLIPQLFLLVAMLPATMAAPGANMNDEHAPRALVGLPSSTCGSHKCTEAQGLYCCPTNTGDGKYYCYNSLPCPDMLGA